MVKITFQFCILCLLCWNVIFMLESQNCKVITAKYMSEIYDDESIFHCSSIREKDIPTELSTLLQHVIDYLKISLNLDLYLPSFFSFLFFFNIFAFHNCVCIQNKFLDPEGNTNQFGIISYTVHPSKICSIQQVIIWSYGEMASIAGVKIGAN